MEAYKVDSHISRRFPPIRLKNRRTFAPFTKKTTSILVGNPLEELAYQDTCCGSCQFNAGIYNVMPPQKRSFIEKVPRCSSGRASAHVGGQNPLTSDGIYHLFLPFQEKRSITSQHTSRRRSRTFGSRKIAGCARYRATCFCVSVTCSACRSCAICRISSR